MTKTFISAGAIVLSLVAIAWATDKPGDKPAQAESPKATSATFMITGLHCPACVKTIEGSLGKVQGVRSIKVDWDAKNAKSRIRRIDRPCRQSRAIDRRHTAHDGTVHALRRTTGA